MQSKNNWGILDWEKSLGESRLEKWLFFHVKRLICWNQCLIGNLAWSPKFLLFLQICLKPGEIFLGPLPELSGHIFLRHSKWIVFQALWLCPTPERFPADSLQRIRHRRRDRTIEGCYRSSPERHIGEWTRLYKSRIARKTYFPLYRWFPCTGVPRGKVARESFSNGATGEDVLLGLCTLWLHNSRDAY